MTRNSDLPVYQDYPGALLNPGEKRDNCYKFCNKFSHLMAYISPKVDLRIKTSSLRALAVRNISGITETSTS